MTSAEVSGWLEYMQMDDEVQTVKIARAITMAFKVEKKPRSAAFDEDDEEVIDTTDPNFAKHFKGFTNTPVAPTRKPQGFRGTEILMG